MPPNVPSYNAVGLIIKEMHCGTVSPARKPCGFIMVGSLNLLVSQWRCWYGMEAGMSGRTGNPRFSTTCNQRKARRNLYNSF